MTTLGRVKELLASKSRRLKRDEKRRQREYATKREASRAGSYPDARLGDLPSDWFKTVSSKQRRKDHRAAIWDAIFVRLHRFADPFAVYRSKLDHEAIQARSRLMLAKSNPEMESQDEAVASRLRADAAYEAESIKIFEEIIEKVGVEYHKELEESIDSEINELQGSYQNWKEYLGRPSFFERFEDLRSWFAGQKKVEKDPEEKPNWLERVIDWLLAMFTKYAIPTLVPAEIWFAKPGFQFLTPEDKYAALAAAIAFAGLLVLSGGAFASFVGRSTVNCIVREGSDNKLVMKTTTRRWTLAVAGLFLFLGFAMSLSGAYLRSKIPEISHYFEDRSHFVEDQNALQEDANSHGMKPEDYARAEQDFRKRSSELAADYQRIRFGAFPFFAADSLVAICIYLAIFMVAFAKRMLSIDPILEYGLIASNLMELKAFKRMIINWREGERRTYLQQTAAARDRLARVRANLGIVAPRDPSALPEASPIEEPAELVEDQLDPAEAFDIPSAEEVVASWKAVRLRNYTRVYVLLKGARLAQEQQAKIPSYLGA